MTPENLEKMTMNNTVSIATLTEIATNTSKDVDKLVKHMNAALPIHEKVESLEKRANALDGRLWKVIAAGVTYLLSLCAYLLIKLLNIGS